VWDGHGNPEHFLCHMQGTQEVLKDMGLFGKYEEARQKVSRAKEQVQEQQDLCDVVLEQIENTVLESDKEPLCEEVAKHSEAIKEFKAAVAEAKQEQVAAMATIFSTTANFFRRDGKPRGTTLSTNKPRRTRGRSFKKTFKYLRTRKAVLTLVQI
jgi:seryl-tRNA synthetase